VFKGHAAAYIDGEETIDSLVIELRQYARRYCAMALGKYSPLRLNKGLGQLDSWNADEIQTRATRLADDALQIWTMPELSAESLAEFEGKRSESDFSVEDHPHLLPHPRRELFEKFNAEVLALDPGITQHFLKLYVAFKAETNVVDVVLKKLGCGSASTFRWRHSTMSGT
jgi:hypothetical protein